MVGPLFLPKDKINMTDKCIYNYTCEVLMDLYSLDASPAELVKSQTKVNYTKLDSEKLRQSVKTLNEVLPINRCDLWY